MTEYTDHDIDQMIDEILTPESAPDLETRNCVRCLKPFQAKTKSTRKYCKKCLTELRQIGGRNSKPNTKTRTETAPEPSPAIFSGDQQKMQLTVRRLMELLGTVPNPDQVPVLVNSAQVGAVELHSRWTPEEDRNENTLYIWEANHGV